MLSLLDNDLFADDVFPDDFDLETADAPPKPTPPALPNDATLPHTTGPANSDAGYQTTTGSAARPETNVGTGGSRPTSVAPVRSPTVGSEFDFGEDGYDDVDFELADVVSRSSGKLTGAELPLAAAHSNRAGPVTTVEKLSTRSATAIPGGTHTQLQRPGPSRSLPQSSRDGSLSPAVPPKFRLLEPSRSPCVEAWRTTYQNEAWLELERDLASLEPTRDASSVLKRFNLASVIRKAERKTLPNRKARLVFVLLDSITHTNTDASATFVDPTGKISGTIHQDLLKKYPTQMRTGSVFVLGQVSVFSPRPKRHYLSVTPQSLLHMYWIKDQEKVVREQLVETPWAELVEDAEIDFRRSRIDTPEPLKLARPCPDISQSLSTFVSSRATAPPVRQNHGAARLAQARFAAAAPPDVPGPLAPGRGGPVTQSSARKPSPDVRRESTEVQIPSQPLDTENLWADDDLTDDIFVNIDCGD